MNLFDSSFLCLDIGTSGVRGIAHRIKSGQIDKSAVFSIQSPDIAFALMSVVDELERQIGVHFDSAFVTGNFGNAAFDISLKTIRWSGEHKITPADIKMQASQITPPDGFFPMHIIPLRYDTPGARNMDSPIGHTDRQLMSIFSSISYAHARLDKIQAALRRAHIQANGFYDPQFLMNATIRQKKQVAMFIDFGNEFVSASIWTDRGPVWLEKFPNGGGEITTAISEKMQIDPTEATRIKHASISMIPREMDRFTPADTAYEFSRADICEIAVPHIMNTIAAILEAASSVLEKYKPSLITICGGGAEIDGISDVIESAFGIKVDVAPPDAVVRALSNYIWNCEEAHRQAYSARREKLARYKEKITKLFHRRRIKKRTRFIPILPSTLCFNMKSPVTYSLFQSGGISMIHVDIMDGLYVDRIAGGIDELKYIRVHTRAHLHVHLMTESPGVWAADAAAAGANTIILSTNTSGLRAALRAVRAGGRRAGVALNPDSPVSLLKPILRDVDEIMVMTVAPGAAGQAFHPECLHKISVLAATRKKYGLKFTISVDGGINDKTAPLCWEAGADLLVSGSYLARSSDFPLAVQSLLKKSGD